MGIRGKENRYTRHLNKHAVQKKLRAKNKVSGYLGGLELGRGSASLCDTSLPGHSCGVIAGLKQANIFKVYTNNKVLKECKVNKAAFHEGGNHITLAVGDKVVFNARHEIIKLLPRKSFLARLRGDNTRLSAHHKVLHLIATNIDIAVIVSTFAEPDFAPGLIDRYLILCQYGGITPLICLNKCDLTTIRHPILDWYKLVLRVEVIETSTYDNIGIGTLQDSILGKVAVFIGASGVGKSSLINRISGRDLKTQSVSRKGRQGKHTTTTSNLYTLPGETYIIDTPGIRNLDIETIELQELNQYFPEFKDFEQACQYANCSHIHEPGCAVKRAQEQNPLYKMRYQSYLNISTSYKRL